MRITSVGACTPVGFDMPSAAAAVRAGVAGFGEHPFMVDRAGDKVVVARVPFGGEMTQAQRMRDMARAALHEALTKAAIGRVQGRVAMFLAVPRPRPGFTQEDRAMVVAALTADLAQQGISVDVQLIDAGHAGGLLALGACADAMARQAMPWALVGGVDSLLDADLLDALEADDRLHNAGNPHGLIPGEGAAFCVVTGGAAAGHDDARSTDEASKQAGVPLRIAGLGSAVEAIPRRGEEPCLGRGLTDAIEAAITGLPAAVKIDEIMSDYNGEWDRADEFGFALVRTSDRFVDGSAMRTPADCWGDVGAATGVLLMALAWQAVQRNWLAGPHVLVWCSSDEAHRAAVWLHADR